MRDFVVLDFETANHNRSSVCAVGFVRVKSGEITDTLSWLVRPQPTYFSKRNIEIHGIDKERVRDVAEFPAVWDEIHPLIGDTTLAAYNATFDMGALHAVLETHRLPPNQARWSCVMRLARQAWPSLGKYNLPNVARSLGIELRHHDPLSDAHVCAQVALQALGILGLSDIPILDSHPATPPPPPDEVMTGFCNIVRTMTQDGVITAAEFESLQDWLSTHLASLSKWPYSEVAQRVCEITADNCVTELELSELLAFFRAFRTDVHSEPVAPGIFTCDERAVSFQKKTFVLTGEMASMGRCRTEDLIRSLGGQISGSVTRHTDYLIVGSKGSQAWKDGCRGGKITNAQTIRREGGTVQIVSEESFLRATAIDASA